MGSEAAVLEPAADAGADLGGLLLSVPMSAVEGVMKMESPSPPEHSLVDDDILSAAACEQILDKILVSEDGSSQLASLDWEDGLSELFPDLNWNNFMKTYLP